MDRIKFRRRCGDEENSLLFHGMKACKPSTSEAVIGSLRSLKGRSRTDVLGRSVSLPA
jgi:hypothetical protein